MSQFLRFYRPTPYNKETKEQIWGTIFSDSHDQFCGCTEPAAHFLSTLFPEDHPARNQTIDNFIKSCFKRQICLFGGKEEKDGTTEAEGGPTTKENTERQETEDLTEENIKDLIAAAEDAEAR